MKRLFVVIMVFLFTFAFASDDYSGKSMEEIMKSLSDEVKSSGGYSVTVDVGSEEKKGKEKKQEEEMVHFSKVPPSMLPRTFYVGPTDYLSPEADKAFKDNFINNIFKKGGVVLTSGKEEIHLNEDGAVYSQIYHFSEGDEASQGFYSIYLTEDTNQVFIVFKSYYEINEKNFKDSLTSKNPDFILFPVVYSEKDKILVLARSYPINDFLGQATVYKFKFKK